MEIHIRICIYLYMSIYKKLECVVGIGYFSMDSDSQVSSKNAIILPFYFEIP